MTMRVSSSSKRLHITKTFSAVWANDSEFQLRQLWRSQLHCRILDHRTDMERAVYSRSVFPTLSFMPFMLQKL